MPKLSPTHCFRAEKGQKANAKCVAKKSPKNRRILGRRKRPIGPCGVGGSTAARHASETKLPSHPSPHHIITTAPSVSSQWREIVHIMSSPQQQQLPPERSIFGVDPLDDFATMVGDWIFANSQGRSNVEVSIADRRSRIVTIRMTDSRCHTLRPL